MQTPEEEWAEGISVEPFLELLTVINERYSVPMIMQRHFHFIQQLFALSSEELWYKIMVEFKCYIKAVQILYASSLKSMESRISSDKLQSKYFRHVSRMWVLLRVKALSPERFSSRFVCSWTPSKTSSIYANDTRNERTREVNDNQTQRDYFRW